MGKVRFVIFIVALLLLSNRGFSQKTNNATVRGFVYETETGEPAMFCNVSLDGTTYGASTDINGYFLISKVPPGKYTLVVTYLGFDTVRSNVNLINGEILTRNYHLKTSSVQLQMVEVNAERQASRTQTKTSVVSIAPKAIKQIPSIGGQADIAQYLQVVPGVVFTGDQGGQFYIRGGSPIQNKVILDGMTIYNPFHSIGLFSVFETDLIRNADIYTGGYNANYGGRISSIIDITYKDGNKHRISGAVGASTFGARLLLEGPIIKATDKNKTSLTLTLSAKNSYLAQSSKVLYKYINEDGLPFNYTDLYGKMTLNGSNGSKVSLFGFNFKDNVLQYKSISDFGWNSWGAGGNFVVIPGSSPILIEGLFAYSEYQSRINSSALSPRSSFIGGFNGKIDFTYFFGKNEMKYGVELQGYRTDYSFQGANDVSISEIENSTQLGAYIKYKTTIGKLIIEPGFRVEWYASMSEVSPEPRLSIKYNVTDYFRLKFAGGMYSQNFVAASSDRDVVNLFYGFLTSPTNIPSNFDGKPVISKLQKADHAILGAEFDLGKHINLNLESYYKYFPQLTNINRQKIYNENSAPPGATDLQTKDYILEKGNAYGLDFLLKYNARKVNVWFVYSLGYVHRMFENDEANLISYTPHFDRRHNINFVFSYVTGSKKQWELNARWNLGTGFPFTQVQGFYEHLSMPGGVNTDYITENGQLGLIYGELYGGRLPVYHRLDLDFKRNFFFSKNSKLVVDLSIINVYNRKNIFYVDLVSGEVVYQLPFMPSFGINYYF
ncbi:MAG: TonB-dependent receptor [Bacteroidetes bacterium]|nr:MAG: TonB-dependent receptor [Bacteroidota bacterium]